MIKGFSLKGLTILISAVLIASSAGFYWWGLEQAGSLALDTRHEPTPLATIFGSADGVNTVEQSMDKRDSVEADAEAVEDEESVEIEGEIKKETASLSFAGYAALYRQTIVHVLQQNPQPGFSTDEVLQKLPRQQMPPPHCAQQQKSRGILLLHGLSDSPYFMRALGDFFNRHCFMTLSLVMPGHATRPGDLREADHQQWLAALDYGWQQLGEKVDERHVAGFSMGASLALAAPDVLNQAAALWFFVPALESKPQALLVHVFEWLALLNPRLAWLDLLPDEDPYKYESFPYQAILQSTRLIRRAWDVFDNALEDKAASLPPLFVAVSAEDTTVDVNATYRLFDRWPEAQKKLLVFAADPAQELPLATSSADIVAAANASPTLLSLSHTALTIPPEDPVYGRDGVYRDCRHYFKKEQALYRKCKQGQADFIGETTAENLQRGSVERLRYNPHWELMLAKMQQFLQELDEAAQ